MGFIYKNNPKKFKIVFLSLMIIGFIFIYTFYKKFDNTKENFLSNLQNKANLSINEVSHTASKDGVKQWSLDAKVVHYFQKTNEAIFEEPKITFFLKNNKKVYMTAKQATLSTSTNDLVITGDIIIKNEIYKIKANRLNYIHKNRVITSSLPVAISSDSLNMTANTFSLDLETYKTILEGKVEGWFNENFVL